MTKYDVMWGSELDPKKTINCESGDPYDVPRDGVWREYPPYSDHYLKHTVWISDGDEVENYPYYKEDMEPKQMASGNFSIVWMWPVDGDLGCKGTPPLSPRKVGIYNVKHCKTCECK